jgi:hypothetical protein
MKSPRLRYSLNKVEHTHKRYLVYEQCMIVDGRTNRTNMLTDGAESNDNPGANTV